MPGLPDMLLNPLRWLLCTALLLPCAAPQAASYPCGNDRTHDGEERLEGDREAGCVLEGTPLHDYINAVGDRLAAVDYDPEAYSFYVIDDPMENAEAIGDGILYMFRGILPYFETEDMMAAVMAHEIGHDVLRHRQRLKSNEASGNIIAQVAGLATAILTGSNWAGSEVARAGQVTGVVNLMEYKRDMELEADAIAVHLLRGAGYDPYAMVEVVHMMNDWRRYAAEVEGAQSAAQGLLASHPSDDRRLYEVLRNPALDEPPEFRPPVGDFLEMLDGLQWGDAAVRGLIDGERYYHSGLRVVLDFPDGWVLTDTASVLLGVPTHGPRAEVGIEVKGREDAEQAPAEFLAEALGVELRGGREVDVNGLQGYLASVVPGSDEVAAEGTGDHDGEDSGAPPEDVADTAATDADDEYELELAAVVFKDGLGYVFHGSNYTEDYQSDFIRAFTSTVASFRVMTREDAEEATMTRIHIVEAEPDDTYATLAMQSSLSRNAEERLRQINGDYPGGEPRPGDRIKIVQ